MKHWYKIELEIKKVHMLCKTWVGTKAKNLFINPFRFVSTARTFALKTLIPPTNRNDAQNKYVAALNNIQYALIQN